jgi:anaerobic dimethyl sulfoxide reductase subunit B (iron-sulfur subunit)
LRGLERRDTMATKQLGFYVNLADCTGCRACQIACKDKNDLPIGVRWRRVLEYSGGEWVPSGNSMVPSDVYTYFVSVACMHCEDPPCVRVCPVSGITKRDADGVVLVDTEICIGCRYCSWACPYGALWFNEETNGITKCDFCVDLMAKGENPACVDACPYRAIEYGPLDELKAKYGKLKDPAPLPDSAMTSPSVVYAPHRSTKTSQGSNGTILNLEEV